VGETNTVIHESNIRRKYDWAIDIVRQHFTRGIEQLCDPEFLQRRYEEFLSKQDPVYGDLLAGMKDEPLSKTFVSYWTIAQTMATQSRFWLEGAVAQIIIHQVRHFGRQATHVLTQSLLADGGISVQVHQIGEEQLEHLSSSKPWRPEIQQGALDKVDLLVGAQERERVAQRSESTPRQWQQPNQKGLIDRDKRHLADVADSISGPPASLNLNCNLLVIEPDKPDGQTHAWGFRFVNPKTLSSHPDRKQERANLLRLYAWLVQEKILRSAGSIRIAVAELLPRFSAFDHRDRYPDYFSAWTYWDSKQLWRFIEVPFRVVSLAIADAAPDFRDRLRAGLRDLLPSPAGSRTPAPESPVKGSGQWT
jgi:hypothetical protein